MEIPFEQYLCKMEGKWNGKYYNKIEIEKGNGIGVEKEWKIKFKLPGIEIWWNGMELEWKWNGPSTKKKVDK